MTEEAQNHPAPELQPELRPEVRGWCEIWKDCLQNVVSQVAGQPHVFELSAQPVTAADSDAWYTVVAGGAVHGEMTLRLPPASATRLAQKFLGEPAASEGSLAGSASTTSEHKEALEELLRQVAGLAATALAANAGGEVQLHLEQSGAPSWSSDAVASLQARDEAGDLLTLEIKLSPALAAEIQPRVPPALAASTAAQAATPSSIPASASSYRRLMDVGLDVKLRFGSRRMLLRDVLALSAGVVVELDNALHSPVDLLLDGRLIAQGEVVIVDGKYGLRVTEVVESPSVAGGLRDCC